MRILSTAIHLTTSLTQIETQQILLSKGIQMEP